MRLIVILERGGRYRALPDGLKPVAKRRDP